MTKTLYGHFTSFRACTLGYCEMIPWEAPPEALVLSTDSTCGLDYTQALGMLPLC